MVTYCLHFKTRHHEWTEGQLRDDKKWRYCHFKTSGPGSANNCLCKWWQAERASGQSEAASNRGRSKFRATKFGAKKASCSPCMESREELDGPEEHTGSDSSASPPLTTSRKSPGGTGLLNATGNFARWTLQGKTPRLILFLYIYVKTYLPSLFVILRTRTATLHFC